MSTTPRATPPFSPEALEEQYAQALYTYLAHPEEAALSDAYDVGRTALNQGMSPLDLVLLHEAVLDRASAVQPVKLDRLMRARATAFLVESLSPFEMTCRRFLEANAALRGINEVLESEVRRTARQIHDGAGQLLFSLQLALTEVVRDLPPRWRPHLDRSLALVEQLDQQLRSLSRDLYPVSLDDLGLEPALRHLLSGVSARNGLSVDLQCSWSARPSRAIESCFYRAVYEAVANIVKHAGATSITVTLDRVGNTLVCCVRDDGQGFSPEAVTRRTLRGLGLIGIRERLKGLQGELDLRSSPGHGTQLIMSIPADAEEHSDGRSSSHR
jgi:signal transduction histidine kinase